MVHMTTIHNSAAFIPAVPMTALLTQNLRTAKLSDFRAPTPKILFGQRLKEITDIENSIAKHGLMMPLKVSRAGEKLIVIDGRKRLAALRRLRFKNTLPRSLAVIPYVLCPEAAPISCKEPH